MKFLLATFVVAVALLAPSTAAAHGLGCHSKMPLAKLHKCQHASLTHANGVVKFFEKRSKTPNKFAQYRYHKKATTWLKRELAETTARLYPPQPVVVSLSGTCYSCWYRVASCESGYGGPPNWSINTGNGFYGGLQFTISTWNWAQKLAGVYYASRADYATSAQQIHIAETLRRHDGIGHWPVCGKRF